MQKQLKKEDADTIKEEDEETIKEDDENFQIEFHQIKENKKVKFIKSSSLRW